MRILLVTGEIRRLLPGRSLDHALALAAQFQRMSSSVVVIAPKVREAARLSNRGDSGGWHVGHWYGVILAVPGNGELEDPVGRIFAAVDAVHVLEGSSEKVCRLASEVAARCRAPVVYSPIGDSDEIPCGLPDGTSISAPGRGVDYRYVDPDSIDSSGTGELPIRIEEEAYIHERLYRELMSLG